MQKQTKKPKPTKSDYYDSEEYMETIEQMANLVTVFPNEFEWEENLKDHPDTDPTNI